MTIDPAHSPARDVYRHMIACITPRPIAWVSTLSRAGVQNLAPYSFFNGVGANPPAIMFSPVNRRDGTRKDTVINIEATAEFVVNVVPAALAEKMNQTSEELAPQMSEFATAGLTAVPSTRVRPPRVGESPVQMECELHDIIRVGDGPLSANVVIGRIILMHIADEILDGDAQIDPSKLDTIGRMGGSLYSRTKDRFEMERPGGR